MPTTTTVPDTAAVSKLIKCPFGIGASFLGIGPVCLMLLMLRLLLRGALSNLTLAGTMSFLGLMHLVGPILWILDCASVLGLLLLSKRTILDNLSRLVPCLALLDDGLNTVPRAELVAFLELLERTQGSLAVAIDAKYVVRGWSTLRCDNLAAKSHADLWSLVIKHKQRNIQVYKI